MKKKKYTPPKINCNVVVIESSICAGSAIVRPQDSNQQILEEWDEIDEPVKNIDW